jgi:hypothetical protein
MAPTQKTLSVRQLRAELKRRGIDVGLDDDRDTLEALLTSVTTLVTKNDEQQTSQERMDEHFRTDGFSSSQQSDEDGDFEEEEEEEEEMPGWPCTQPSCARRRTRRPRPCQNAVVSPH